MPEPQSRPSQHPRDSLFALLDPTKPHRWRLRCGLSGGMNGEGIIVD